MFEKNQASNLNQQEKDNRQNRAKQRTLMLAKPFTRADFKRGFKAFMVSYYATPESTSMEQIKHFTQEANNEFADALKLMRCSRIGKHRWDSDSRTWKIYI